MRARRRNFWWRPPIRRVLFAVCLLASTPALAQQPATIEPDRPDVTNGVDTVPAGILQIETGAIYINDESIHTLGLPFTARYGIGNRLELRIETASLQSQVVENVRSNGIGDISLGAKVRLWPGGGGVPPCSIQPAVKFPTASMEKGLGSGETDYTATLLTGFDAGINGRVDANYRLGLIGAAGASHFIQHLASISASVTLGQQWSPYAEFYWTSREEPHSAAASVFDAGIIRTITPRLALDAGVQFGVSREAPRFGVFGGLSAMVGRGRSTRAFRQGPGRD